MRQRVYPKWVATGKMKPEASQHEIECMTAIVASLEKLTWLEQISEEIKKDLWEAQHGPGKNSAPSK